MRLVYQIGSPSNSPRKTGVWQKSRAHGRICAVKRTTLLAYVHLCQILVACAATGDVIRTAAELQAATFDRAEVGRRFDVTSRLTTDCRAGDVSSFAVEDDTGAMLLWKAHVDWADKSFTAGTLVRAQGFIGTGRRSKHAYAKCEAVTPISSGPAPKPVTVTATEFLSGKFDCRLVTIRGTVRDMVTDEIDPNYTYVIVKIGDETISMPCSKDNPSLARLSIGTEIEVSGICAPTILGVRRQIGRTLSPTCVTISEPSSSTGKPFDAPMATDFLYLRPQDVAVLDRHKVKGRVVAAWHGDSALVMADSGRVTRIETDAGCAPSYGDCIEAVGFPESDLYNVNLSRVVWRKTSPMAMPDEKPRDVSADALQTDEGGRRCFDIGFHGHAIRLSGIVRNLPGEENGDGRFNIENGKFVVSVDATATPEAMRDLAIGCKISVAGTCVMDIDNWRPNLPFPAIRGFFVVVRKPADVEILSRPSWWTPPRLLAVVGVLALFLAASLVWTALLKRLAERRGKELAATAIAKVESELKVDERTRLAVELHDSISQNLTGISLAIQAADRLSESAPEGLRNNLKLAASSLDSCRRELKNCLWDLRNNTLDETDMNEAIHRTLSPHVGDAELHVRFNIPRERFSDKTAHTILHVLRELATNAVRHGHAANVRIAGSLEGEELRLSVRDDGCGFDPANCPGMDAGHFGLQGVRERVNSLEGAMEIQSTPGEGAKVTIRLRMSLPADQEIEPGQSQP